MGEPMTTHKGGNEPTEAIRDFLALWDEALPHINNATTFQHVHGIPYKGPNLGPAIERLRELAHPGRSTEDGAI